MDYYDMPQSGYMVRGQLHSHCPAACSPHCHRVEQAQRARSGCEAEVWSPGDHEAGLFLHRVATGSHAAPPHLAQPCTMRANI